MDGVSGYLVNPLDVEATGARHRDAARATASARATWARPGRRRIVELYDWDRVVDIVLRAAVG